MATTASTTPRREIHFVSAKKPFSASLAPQKVSTLPVESQDPVFAAKRPVPTKPSNEEAGLFSLAKATSFLRWQTVARVGPGFFNEGNTCFLNSTLQCLLYVPSFAQCLLHESSTALKNIQGSGKNERAVIELFSALVKDVWQAESSRSSISPKSMVATIRRVGKQFKPFRQEDAHEYLRQLLDCMHEEVLKANGLKISDGKKAETTVISRVFGGYLCNTLSCTRCQYQSKTSNHFQDMSLEIRQGIDSVQTAIRAFTKIENLTQGNEWLCGGCKNKVKATKQLTVQTAPNVLVLHLKRFSFGNMFGKISKHVEISEQLEIPEYSNNNVKYVKYELTGVVVHHGHSTHSGHYIAYVKAPNGQWHEMNDSHVSVVSVKKVLAAQAYILFYSRVPPQGAAPLTITTAAAAALVSQPAQKATEASVVVRSKVEASSLKTMVSVGAKPATVDLDSGAESEDEDEDEDEDEKSYHYRMRLPMRFQGVFSKFRRWKYRNSLTDLRILGRIMHLRAQHAPTSVPQTIDASPSTEPQPIAQAKPDVVSALLEMSRRCRTVGGEGLWETVSAGEKEQVQALAVQQRRQDQQERRKTKLSDWDALLDQGKVKKVKIKYDESESNPHDNGISPFQRVLDERQQQKQRGENVDFREVEMMKHKHNKTAEKNFGDRKFDHKNNHKNNHKNGQFNKNNNRQKFGNKR